MGRVIRTFITAGGYRGEGDLGVSTKAAHSGEGEAAGARMPARPLSPDTAAHRAKQGRNCWRFHDREKVASLLTAYQNPASRRVYGRAPPGFFSLPFGPRAAKSGCGRQPAKSVWLPVASQTLCLPHPWVGKTCLSPDRASTDGSLSVLRGRFGIILLLILSPGSEPRASETSSTKARTAAPIRPVLAGRGRETTSSQHRATQRPTGGHEGFSCFCRSFATRWRSVASSSSASWLA